MKILSQQGMPSNTSVSPSAERKNVGFENLAKTIGARWKSMSSEEERAPYKEKAAVSVSALYRLQCAFPFPICPFHLIVVCICSLIPSGTRMKWQHTRKRQWERSQETKRWLLLVMTSNFYCIRRQIGSRACIIAVK